MPPSWPRTKEPIQPLKENTMKSILIGLTLTLWIASFSAFSQTDSAYCLPISKARLLVAHALRLQLADSLNNLQAARIVLLSDEKQSLVLSYTNLLNISEQKFQKQKEITSDFVRLSDSWRDQSEHYRKEDRKHRRQRNGLAAGMVVVIVLGIIH